MFTFLSWDMLCNWVVDFMSNHINEVVGASLVIALIAMYKGARTTLSILSLVKRSLAWSYRLVRPNHQLGLVAKLVCDSLKGTSADQMVIDSWQVKTFADGEVREATRLLTPRLEVRFDYDGNLESIFTLGRQDKKSVLHRLNAYDKKVVIKEANAAIKLHRQVVSDCEEMQIIDDLTMPSGQQGKPTQSTWHVQYNGQVEVGLAEWIEPQNGKDIRNLTPVSEPIQHPSKEQLADATINCKAAQDKAHKAMAKVANLNEIRKIVQGKAS